MVDFDDEEDVLREMARALKEDADDLTIDESGRGLTSFGTDTFYFVEHGSRGWVVARDYDAMEEVAVAVVQQDVESEPEIFNPGFLEQHINVDRLRRDLHSDVYSMAYDDLSEMDPDDFWDEAERYDVPRKKRAPNSIDIETVAEKVTDERLEDPMQYLEDIYGREDAVKQAIDIAGIDAEAAARDAVTTDGPAHFLAHYDGNYYETPGGLVYWRTD